MRSMRFAAGFARVFALAVTLTFGMRVASAQPPNRRPVRVAIPNEFPSTDARALIVRFASPEKGDVIVLRETEVTAQTLVAAVALLHRLRKSGAVPDHDEVVSVKGFVPLGRGDARLASRLSVILERLRAQPVARIGNLGQGRWLDVPDAALLRT